MAEKIIRTRVSDISGAEEATTRTLGLNGKWYEIDLTEAEFSEFAAKMEKYLSNGRKLGTRRRSLGHREVPETTFEQREAIRAWAKENGFEVLDKGRIAKAVYDAYFAAHPDLQPAA